MQSLRSVITQATRGGRWILSLRNFSSHCVCREANGSVERVLKRERTVSGKETNGAALSAIRRAVWKLGVGASFGYITSHDKLEEGKNRMKQQKEKLLREVKTLQSCRSIAADM